jgi:acetyl-CoA carboxylase biotin carboxyl carrier protein
MSVPRRRSVKSKAPAQPARRGKSAAARSARSASSSFPEVEELVQLMDRHGLLEVDWETGADGTRRVRVSRAGHAAPAGPVHVGLAPMPAVQPAPSAAAAGSAPSKPAPPPAHSTEGLHIFKSPMVGTFYRAPSPEAAPFVSVGDKIDEHSTVCIIEAMKVMNEITPDKSGEVVSIEVENGEAVEFGQPLFLIRAS